MTEEFVEKVFSRFVIATNSTTHKPALVSMLSKDENNEINPNKSYLIYEQNKTCNVNVEGLFGVVLNDGIETHTLFILARDAKEALSQAFHVKKIYNEEEQKTYFHKVKRLPLIIRGWGDCEF